jgi:hypothetical protein
MLFSTLARNGWVPQSPTLRGRWIEQYVKSDAHIMSVKYEFQRGTGNEIGWGATTMLDLRKITARTSASASFTTPERSRVAISSDCANSWGSADRRVEITRLIVLDASVVEDFDNHTWMSDPKGNNFCIVDS